MGEPGKNNSLGRETDAARESESLYQVELRGKCRSCHGWGANVLSNFPKMFLQHAGKGREGKGDVLPLPRLIITWQFGGAAGGVATRTATSLLSWCL